MRVLVQQVPLLPRVGLPIPLMFRSNDVQTCMNGACTYLKGVFRSRPLIDGTLKNAAPHITVRYYSTEPSRVASFAFLLRTSSVYGTSTSTEVTESSTLVSLDLHVCHWKCGFNGNFGFRLIILRDWHLMQYFFHVTKPKTHGLRVRVSRTST